MAIGINEFDDDVFDDVNQESDFEDISQEEELFDESDSPDEQSSEDEFISELLRSRGIDDPSKIKFEDEDGELEEISWKKLSTSDKLNILDSSEEHYNPEEGLDDSEIELINAIRLSNLTPAEYLQHLSNTSVANYINNVASQNQVYSIDQYSDEELFVMDQISKSQDMTEAEAIELLERVKANDSLFRKQAEALRNTYRREEDNYIQQNRLIQEQEAYARFNYFSEQIQDAILNLRNWGGGDLELNEDDMNNIYTFVTGTDSAGNNWFNKALQDPNLVVQMANWLLNGDKMIADINDYYQKEITKVRKESYNKGLNDRGKSKVAYIPKNNNNVYSSNFDDLDEEF